MDHYVAIEQNMGGVLVVGKSAKMPPAEVPLSNVPNPQMLKWGPAMNWRLLQGCSLPSPICAPAPSGFNSTLYVEPSNVKRDRLKAPNTF